MNYSKQREIIFEALKENVVHPTAETLYEIIKKNYPDVSKATLYRNLSLLTDLGVIKKIDGLESSAHFDHNTHLHYHFICDCCGKIFDVTSNVAQNVVDKTEMETGFNVTNHEFVFHGLCNDCKEKGE